MANNHPPLPPGILTIKSKSHGTYAISNKYITYNNNNSQPVKEKDTQADLKIQN